VPVDKWNYPMIYQRKAGGFMYELSKDPNNDDFFDAIVKMTESDGGWKWANTDSIRPKGCRDPNFDGIGCDMDQGTAHKNGFGWKKATDFRDLEFKCALKVNDSGGGQNDFTLQVVTGRHTTPQPCHEGSAYGISIEYATNPVTFRWSKEQAHSEYSYKSRFTKTSFLNNKLEGLGRYVGFGLIRFNTADGVKIIFIGNPDPDANPKNWMIIDEIEDVGGWGDHDARDYGADNKDQILDWAMPVAFRIKMTDPDLDTTMKNLTVFEVDPVPSGTGGGDESGGSEGGGSEVTVKYTYESKFGSKGSGNGQFLDPHDISFDALTPTANLFVCDRERNDVQKFTHAGVYISKFGSAGSGNGQFNVPYAIQHTPDYSAIYVCDRDNDRIQKFDSSGTWLANITTINGKALSSPEDISFDKSNGDIYILDTGNNRCCKLNSAHTFIRQWGKTGSHNGEFDHPHSINVDSAGDVFISCGNQPYIQKFDKNGTFLMKFGSEGTGEGQTQMFLEHMDIDIADRVHLINNDSRPIINVWNNQGVWLTQYGKTTSGSANGQFNEPEHVTCDSTGKPFVVDAQNQRIQIFSVVTSGGSGGGGGTQTPSTTFGFAELQIRRHINFERSSPCSAGLVELYNQSTQNGDTNLDAAGDRSGMRCANTSAKFYNKIINTGLVYLEKHGAGQDVFVKIRRGTDNSVVRSMATISKASIGTSETECSFSDLSNTYRMKIEDRISFECDGNSTDYISIYRHDTVEYDQPNTRRFTRLDGSTEWKNGALKLVLNGKL